MKNKRISVKMYMAGMIVVVVAILLSILGGLMIYQSRTTANKLILETAHVTALYAANAIDVESLEKVTVGSEGTEEYKKVYENLQTVIEGTDALYAYTMYSDGAKAYNGVVVGYEERVGTDVQAEYSHIAPAFNGIEVLDQTVYDTPYGRIINSYVPIFNRDGQVVGALGCTFDADCIRDTQNQNTMIVVVAVVISLIIILVLCMVFVSRLVSPIYGANKILDKLSVGDLSDNEGLGYSNNEIGDIITKVSEVQQQLVKIIRDIQTQLETMAKGDFSQNDTNFDVYVGSYQDIAKAMVAIRNNLRETLEHVQMEASQVALGANQISEGAQTISQGAVVQTEQIERLSTGMNAVVERVKDTAASAMNIKEAAHDSETAISLSDDNMKNLISSMDDVYQKSNQIVSIVKNIDDIAFQTNILALNAAIEAARAGQSGKGFSVVADEVRTLAAKVADSAKNADNIINETVAVVSNSIALANNTAESLNQVVSLNHDMIEKVDDIQGKCNEQVEDVERISEGAATVLSVVQSNSAAAEESAAASQELSAQAETLNQLVGKFVLH